MAKAKATNGKPKPPTPKKEEPKDKFIDNGDLFLIEEEPPKRIRGVNPEAAKVLEKVEKTLSNVKEGQAFLVPKMYLHTIKRYLSQEHKESNFLYSTVEKNDAAMRVYKASLDSVTKKKREKEKETA